MDFSTGSGGKSSLSPQDRSALMSNIKQQLDVAHAQELLQQINEKCFKMCVQKPSSSLSSSDQVNSFSF
jgi:import inner membrane translocase subunit TIM13